MNVLVLAECYSRQALADPLRFARFASPRQDVYCTEEHVAGDLRQCQQMRK